MPTYEYACKKCEEKFDVVQSFADEPLKRHKGCGGSVKRVFGSVGISFKGSGFYKNDSRSSSSSSSRSESSGESKTESKSESSSDAKHSESKSESTSDSKSEKKSDAKPDKKPAKAASTT